MPKLNPTVEDRSWYEFVAAKGDDPAEILIYDYIGSYGVTAANFDRDLKALGPQANLVMRINSPGGETPSAASIYNMLERYKVKNNTDLTVVIDGIAASAASWIAMLGDEVIMPENSLMMIHDPSGFAMGTSRDMRSLAAVLDKIKQGMVAAYVKKSGQSREDVEAIMEAETWYDAQEAVDAGFADRVDNPIEIAAAMDGFSGYLAHFKNPPEVPVVARARSGAHQETPMVTKPNETPAEMEARLRAEITASLAAAPKPEPVVAPVIPVAETPAAMEARIRGEVTSANADINALCKIAGKPEKATEYIAQGKTPTQVRDDLANAAPAPRAQGNGQSQMNTHGQQAPGAMEENHDDLVAKAPNTAKIWANFRAGKATPFEGRA